MWDANQYLKFAGERARPFHDLLAQVRRDDVRTVADLGCGPGGLTRVLTERWPNARVIGVDHSPDMLAQAQPLAIPGRLSFVQSDLAAWQPDIPVDVLLSNAALHWVADHPRLLSALAAKLAPGGTLAVQMPRHFDMPAQQAIQETVHQPRWQAHLRGVGLQPGAVQPLTWYVRQLLEMGFTVDAWETLHIHILTGKDPVLEWVKGTALRPYLSRLGPEETSAFLAELSERLRAIYPEETGRTIFPFPRLYLVATRVHA